MTFSVIHFFPFDVMLYEVQLAAIVLNTVGLQQNCIPEAQRCVALYSLHPWLNYSFRVVPDDCQTKTVLIVKTDTRKVDANAIIR